MAETRIRLDKQIQKAPAVNMVPLSDGNGELQFANIGGLIKTGETLTRLNSVEINGGNLIIKYTAEDGIQQVVSTALNFSQTDVKINDAKLDNPSTGVYRLLITETDGKTYPVDLSALLAVVTQNTEYVRISGNGTPQNPLSIDLTDVFWNQIPRTLDALDDVYTSREIIDQEVSKGGNVVLIYDYEQRQWLPRSSRSLDSYYEVTETFPEYRAGNAVFLQMNISQIVNGSIKVYRNGLRQAYGIDYDYGKQGEPNGIQFYVPFNDKFPETVIVDYRPASF
ncbi:hypothetical protein [Taibaiella soli]|uniref:Uncharacterized protein n=1 Tax=Taibaiella soli TaxID=1649169 RepID=A0A2W2A886_9BACT|nr:hypothetical protein [Taibaiella soli]PZF71565.1 hypothetical protein DN068_15940 [Taibaiella soli]